MSFTLLWQQILRSSLWVRESKETRLVWITLLALKDKDGVIKSSVVGLADDAKVSDEECKKALIALTSPDPNDTSGIDEGRRIKAIPGGWQIVNNDKYRFSTEAKREFWKQSQQQYRASKKQTPAPCPDLSEPVKTPKKMVGLVFPDKFATLKFNEKWEQWVEFRKSGKKVKNWNALFSEQLNWLAKYSEDDAIEVMSASIRNGWTGLFEPKSNWFNNAKPTPPKFGFYQP